MLKRLVSGFAAICLAASQSAAQGVVYESDSGDQYVLQCNAHGYELSVLPFGAKVYLGGSCDAYSDFFGTGYWCVANGGTMFKVGSFEAYFTRAEFFCPETGYSTFSCLCGDL